MQVIRSYILVLFLALAGCMAKKGLARSEFLKVEAPTGPGVLAQPILEPDPVVLALEVTEQEFIIDPVILTEHRELIHQRSQQINDLSEEVAQIRRELLLRRAAELEKESEKEKWHKSPPREGKSRKHYQEWRYMQQNQKVLGLEGQIPKDDGAILAPAPNWRVE